MTQQRNHRISDWLYHTNLFARFYGRMAGRFAVDILWDDFHNNFLSRVPDGGTILEVGAGPGLLALKILKNLPTVNLIVTDYSPNMLDLARANLEKATRENNVIAAHKAQLEYLQANAMDLSQFVGCKIDGVYSMGAAKHFPDPVVCLNQAQGVLADRGVMYFADSCADGKYSGTKEIVTKLNLSPIASIFLRPIIHFGLKRESPSATEVKSWQNGFSCDGELKVDFSLSGSIFKLMYQKNETLSTTDNST